ncbi:MAG: hypothetical protein JNK29_19735, partial [Anaerolineales bacterium]|nr:hypothetical protein [Anaerolineales bacterium]
MPSTFQRVWQAAQRGWAFLRKGPAYVGAFAGWQARRWARRRRLLPRPWQAGPAALWTQLDARRAELAPAVQAARRGETAAAQGALHAYFRQRPAPRFFFTWADRPALQALIPPAAQAAT